MPQAFVQKLLKNTKTFPQLQDNLPLFLGTVNAIATYPTANILQIP